MNLVGVGGGARHLSEKGTREQRTNMEIYRGHATAGIKTAATISPEEIRKIVQVGKMKHKQQRRSYCPINFALESFGDPWSLLIIRDIVYFGKKTYGEFFASEEGIATNILASRLAQMEKLGIIAKRQSKTEKRKEEYTLTEKGLDIIPLLVEMASWSALHDPETAAPADWIALCNARKSEMIQMIRETVRDGGAVFVGPGSVLSKLAGEEQQM